MRITLERVPYFSQWNHVQKEEWRARACTFTCLKMAMDYVLRDQDIVIPSIDFMFSEAEAIERMMVRDKKITAESLSSGKRHDTIIKVAHNHGALAHPEEFKSVTIRANNLGIDKVEPGCFEERMVNAGIGRISQSILHDSPVIVSVARGFQENGTPHSILIVGCEIGSGLYYLDPDSQDPEVPRTLPFISNECFKTHWRRLAIFVDALPE